MISTANIPQFADTEEPNYDENKYVVDCYLLDTSGGKALAVEVGFTEENYAREFSTIAFSTATLPLAARCVADSVPARRQQR